MNSDEKGWVRPKRPSKFEPYERTRERKRHKPDSLIERIPGIDRLEVAFAFCALFCCCSLTFFYVICLLCHFISVKLSQK